MIITIDGRAGTGKTTVARLLAKRLGFLYVDTGAMYRVASYLLLKKGISLKDSERVVDFLKDFSFKIVHEGESARYFAEGEDVTSIIRSEEVTSFVSQVATLSSVRKALVVIQKRFGEEGNAVFEGRDMGTVVFPNADLKIFLTATEEIAAKRRFLEILSRKGEKITQEEVLKRLQERDALDTEREYSPLKKAEDAYEIDTSKLNIEQVVEKIISLIP